MNFESRSRTANPMTKALPLLFLFVTACIPVAHSSETDVSDSSIESALMFSDGWFRYRDVLTAAAKQLIISEKCSLSDFRYASGWKRSDIYKDKPVFSIYCTADWAALDRIFYVHANTGKVFKNPSRTPDGREIFVFQADYY